MQVIEQLQNSKEFPTFVQGRDCEPLPGTPHGNKCYNNATVTLLDNEKALSILAGYEVDFSHSCEGQAKTEALLELLEVVLVVFGADGYNDFFHLHSITGYRAVYMILTEHTWDNKTVEDTLAAFWRTCMVQYIVRNRP